MSAEKDIFELIKDLQKIKHRFIRLDKRYKLKKIYPSAFSDVCDKIDEASSNAADFYIAFAVWNSSEE